MNRCSGNELPQNTDKRPALGSRLPQLRGPPQRISLLGIGCNYRVVHDPACKCIGEAVVDITVVRFVGADHEDHVAQCGIIG